MLKNRYILSIVLVSLTHLTQAMDPDLLPATAHSRTTSTRPVNPKTAACAGPFFDQLDSFPREHICSFLSFKDITNLRKTCRALRYIAPYSAGPFFDSLGVSQSLPTQYICQFLALKDIAHLRRTCRAMRNTWDHERLLIFTEYQLSLLPQNVTSQSLKQDQLFLTGKLPECRNDIALDFFFKNLTELPEPIRNLIQLKRLNLTLNKLTQPAIANLCTWLPNLQELNLSANELTILPEALRNLTQLQKLDLRANRFTQATQGTIRSWLPGVEIIF